MSKKPKGKNVKEMELPRVEEDFSQGEKESSLGKDQSERGYYYDDAYGYQKYVTDEEESGIKDGAEKGDSVS